MNPLRPRQSDRAIVLIMTVLVLSILALLGYAFSYGAGVNVAAARNSREAARLDAGAQSALAWACSLLRQPAGVSRAPDTLNDAWNSPGLQVTVGEDLFTLRIVDEDRKLNLNRAARRPADESQLDLREPLRRLVAAAGGTDDDAAALRAWVDPDTAGRGDATAPKVPIPVIGALAAIPNLDRRLLTGAEDRTSLYELLSTHPRAININTAADLVLDSIWSAAGIAQTIRDRRASQSFASSEEVDVFLKTLMAPELAAAYTPLFAVRSDYFSVRVTPAAGGAGRGLDALVRRNGAVVELISVSPISKEDNL